MEPGNLELALDPTNLSAQCRACDFAPIPTSSNKYCFLCKYGGFDGVTLAGDCNLDVKAIERHLHHLRKVLGPARAARELKIAFDQFRETNEAIRNEPEWTEESIYDHLVVHAVPEALQRGENVDDFAYEVFAGLLNYQRGLVVNKQTGLVDEKQLRVLLGVADRLYKFSARSTARRKPEGE